MSTYRSITLLSEPKYLNDQHKAASEALTNAAATARATDPGRIDTTKPVDAEQLKAASNKLAEARAKGAGVGRVQRHVVPVTDETDVSNLEGVKPFATADQRQRAFDDPRYKTDPDYRQEVNRRLMVTK
jgi:hypothetical protein